MKCLILLLILVFAKFYDNIFFMDKNIKLIATDLDGTFLNSDSEISDYNKNVFQYLMKEGIEIILSTGRAFNGMQRYKEIINNDNYSIVSNGSMIADTNGNFVYNKVIDENYSKAIIDLRKKYKVYLHVYSGDKYIVSEPDFYYERYIEKENITDTIVGLENIEDFNFSKMVFIGDNDELLKLQNEIRSNFDLHTSFSHPSFLEILAKGINKGSALKWLCEKKGINREEVIAFGDNYNDIEMIEYAGVGVAMGNAEEDVKKKADYVSLSNNEDGVGKFLNNFLNLKIFL